MPHRRTGLFSIAPHAPFLPTLTNALADGHLFSDWPREGAFWLSDITIFVPTQRARHSLVSSLADRFGSSFLLPDIRTLGGEAGEEDLFLPPYDGHELPSSQSSLRRQLLLAAVIEKWTNTAHVGDAILGPAEILRRAEALGEVVDDFNVAQIPLSKLADLNVEDTAGHWAEAKEFLNFAFSVWPAILAEDNRVDSSQLRNLKLARHAQSLAQQFGERPVVVAGSTGSIPATANLLDAVRNLARGALILPGFDRQLDAAHQTRLLDESQNPHGHPQYGLMKLLNRLGVAPELVEELAPSEGAVRTQIVNHALDLPHNTAQWQSVSAPLVSGADGAAELKNFTIIDAKSEGEQAQAICLAAVDALRAQKSVGIISPDRNLARRIAAQLARFDVPVDDAAGMPLFQSRTGRLVRQILTVALSGLDASDLMALLQNANVTLGCSRQEIARRARQLDLAALRGQIPAGSFAEIQKRIGDNPSTKKLARGALRLSEEDAVTLAHMLGSLEKALTPVIETLSGQFGPAALVSSLNTALNLLIEPKDEEEPVRFSGLDDWRAFALEMVSNDINAPALNAGVALSALEGLMSGRVVRLVMSGRPDIDIFGQLEARLQHRDVMILCGLNEGIWPEAADPGPWMGRNMRMLVGLEPPERQHGLAAHDFMIALGNRNVILAYAQRIGSAPAEPSRLLQRLMSFVGEDATKNMIARGAEWRAKAQQLDVPNSAQTPAARPSPSPAAKLRARALSFTEVERLIFSPYDIYAKRTLNFTPLEDLGQTVSHRERGTVLHEIFADFVIEQHDVMGDDAAKILEQLAIKHFALIDSDPDRRDIWLRRFAVSADRFLEFERERNGRVQARYAEQDLSHSFPTANGEFKLYGRADRIDVMQDGTVEIMDFKTGNPPDKTQMQNLMAPQLPLEAYVMAKSGFVGMAPHPASALKFIKIANGPNAFVESDYHCPDGMNVMEAADRTFEMLTRRIAHFLERDDVAMVPNLIPKKGQTYAGAYDHLARKKEWAGLSAEDE